MRPNAKRFASTARSPGWRFLSRSAAALPVPSPSPPLARPARGRRASSVGCVWSREVVGGALSRRQADVALRTSEQRFHSLADNAPVLIWVRGPDRAVHLVQSSMARFRRADDGARARQRLGRATSTPTTSSRAFRRIRSTSTRASRSTWNTASAGTTANGDGCSTTARRTIDTDGVFTGYLGSCIDITEEKHARQEIERLRDQLQAENVYLRQ